MAMPGCAQPLRIGIVGCGRVVQTVHLSALNNIPGLSVSAVCAETGALQIAAEKTAAARTAKHRLMDRPHYKCTNPAVSSSAAA